MNILIKIISAPIRWLLRLYLWAYDYPEDWKLEKKEMERKELHQRIIWELRNTLSQLEKKKV